MDSFSWQRARILRASAHALRALGRYEEAAGRYEEAAALFRRAGDAAEAARCAIGRVDALMYLGRYEVAQREGRIALRVLERTGDRATAARLLNNLANLEYRFDHPERALALYGKARTDLVRQGPAATGRVDANRANCLALRGQPTRATALLRRARTAFRQAGLMVDTAGCDYALAYLLFLRHRYVDALYALAELETSFERLGASDYRALLELDAAEVLLRMGRPHEAERSAGRAAERARSLGLRYEEAKATYFEAVAVATRGDLETARGLLYGAEKQFRGERNRTWQGQCRLARAECNLQSNRAARAEKEARQAAMWFAHGRDAEREGLARVLEARAKLARSGSATRAIGQARRVARRARSPFLRFRVACLMGDAVLAADEMAAARRAYRQAARISESLAGQVRTELFRAADWTSWEDAYPRLVALEMAAGRNAAAFHALERGRARAFEVPRRRGSGRRRPRSLGAALERRLEGLACRLEARRWGRAAGVPASAPFSASSAREEHESARLLERIDRESRAQRGARPVAVASLGELRRDLAEGEILVSFFESERSVHALSVTRDGLRLHARLASAAVVHRWLEEIAYLARVGTRGEDAGPLLAGAIREAAHHLVASWSRDRNGALAHAVVIPEGHMAALPWPALLRHAIGRVIPVSTVPSASAWRSLRLRVPATGSRGAVVLVGSGDALLPEVEKEIADLSLFFPRARVLVGREATASRLRRALAGAEWLHVAGHGRADEERPILSGVRLHDRWAHVPDLCPGGHAPRVTVLSACRTGELVGGWRNDWRGLAGSMLGHGARAVVGSLWDSDDLRSRQLTLEMYGHLARGLSLGQALTRAQNRISSDPQWGWNAWTWGLFGDAQSHAPAGMSRPLRAPSATIDSSPLAVSGANWMP